MLAIKYLLKMIAQTTSNNHHVSGEHSDQEQNSLLVLLDLDQKIRSPSVGTICEAIVCYPDVLDRFPFPTVVNSVVLKLAENFVSTNTNYIRFELIKAFRRIEERNHLVKLMNVDQALKTIDIVMHSNDPIARALTLRLLSVFAAIAPDRKSIHHFIRQSLRSNYLCEVGSAIYAADRVCEYSRAFSVEIFDQLEGIVKHIETSSKVRIQAIPLFRHMHYQFDLANKSKNVLMYLLPRYTEEKLSACILSTLCYLTLRSSIGLTDHSEFLVEHCVADPRAYIRVLALKKLNSVVKFAGHRLYNHGVIADGLFQAILVRVEDLMNEKNFLHRAILIVETLRLFDVVYSLVRENAKSSAVGASKLDYITSDHIDLCLYVSQMLIEEDELEREELGSRTERGRLVVVCLEIVCQVVCLFLSDVGIPETAENVLSTKKITDACVNCLSLCVKVFGMSLEGQSLTQNSEDVDIQLFKRIASCVKKLFQAYHLKIGVSVLQSLCERISSYIELIMGSRSDGARICSRKLVVLLRLYDSLLAFCDTRVYGSNLYIQKRALSVGSRTSNNDSKEKYETEIALQRHAIDESFPILMKLLQKIVEGDLPSAYGVDVESVTVDTCRILFRSVMYCWSSETKGVDDSGNTQLVHRISNLESSTAISLWNLFNISRLGACAGLYSLSSVIFSSISEKVCKSLVGME